MWNDPFETFVGASGQLYTAPVGTTIPAGFTEPPSNVWTGCGYANEDGASFSASQEVEELRAWQSQHPIRRVKTGSDFSIGIALLQWNESNVPLAFGGGSVNPISGGYEYLPPNPEDLDERAAILDLFDGADRMRIIIPRGSTNDTVEGSFSRGSMAELPITFGALEPDNGPLFRIRFSDSAAFAPGS